MRYAFGRPHLVGAGQLALAAATATLVLLVGGFLAWMSSAPIPRCGE
jgi:hypothetical protein